MKQTYFEQLLEELGGIKNPDTLTDIIMRDVYKRSLDWISSFDNPQDGHNTGYIHRQLTYLKNHVDKQKDNVDI